MSIIKPFALVPGDRVGIVAPASSFQRRGLKRAIDKIRWWGFEPVFPKRQFQYSEKRPLRYQQKAQEVIEMLQDPSISAIFCAEGGYGSIALVPYLDKVDLSAHPKIFVGYSDITILLLYLHVHYGWVTFHGPTIASEIYKGMPPNTEESLVTAITQAKRLGEVSGAKIEVLVPGEARGRIVGGNLTRLARTLGTRFEIETKGKILFLEEYDEGYMSLDGSLNHLKLAGKFDGIRGLLFNEMNKCLDNSKKDVRSFLKRFFRDAAFPILWGFPSGHGMENFTIPLGVRAEMNSEIKRLTLLESGVR